MKVPERNYVLR